ncbi:LytTR family DNA-binding domain-containing protein [Olivibacter sp. CPCC 100613]|uniref:LytR/AlgR family response regulator transcription factor n=1 Tax=Olivibacter sp. CPCC 100613 TaxID=3079931 RepID=UPI002FF6D878
MNIIIVEDELKAAKSLATLINKLKPEAKIISQLQSVERAVNYLSNHGMPDLLFMDVQLSDGICFEIFGQVKISCPVIFCTAYGEYAMEAIKANGIDYLLKPFAEADLEMAFEKVMSLKNFFQQHASSDVDQLLKRIGLTEWKSSFLVFKNNKYQTVQTDQIAFIYISYNMASIVTFKEEAYVINQSLDQVQQQLSPRQFYRLNRQYLINFSAIKEVEHYFARKLFVRLLVATPDKLLIGKEKTTNFLHWLEDR